MHIVLIAAGIILLYVSQYLANRLMALTPEKLTKAAVQIGACNELFGRQLLALNRQSANNWAETVDYAHVVAEWSKAATKIFKRFDYLHHAKENTDYRLPLLLIGNAMTIDGVAIPDKFVFRVTDGILKEIAKHSGTQENVILKTMAEQLSANTPLAARFWEFRIFLLGSGKNAETGQATAHGHDKFALLSALHLSFGLNSRNRLLRSRWNTPRIILETLVYVAFQFVTYFLLFSAEMGLGKNLSLTFGHEREDQFMKKIAIAAFFVALATIWFLMRFRRYIHARKFHAILETFLKAGVISRDDLRAYGQLVLGLKPDDGFPWLRE